MNPFLLHIKIVAVVTALFLLAPWGCSGRLTPERYIDYWDSNKDKMTLKITRNNETAKIVHVPAEYYAAQVLCNDSTQNLDSVMNRYSNSIFFAFGVLAAGEGSLSPLISRENQNAYSESVHYNTFERQKDIFLLYKQDTVKATMVKYDRNWGLVKDDVFLIGFSKKRLQAKMNEYHLIIREITPGLGTIDLPLKDVVKTTKRLKG